MADSFSKKEREKKKRQKKQEKAERKKLRNSDESKNDEFMYVDENGNLTSTPPDPSKRTEIDIEEIQISIPKRSELESDDGEKEGLVKFFNTEKRFGFISEKGTKKDFFVHEDNLIDRIKDNDKVTFEIGQGSQGLIAINVKLFRTEKKEKEAENE